MIDANLAEAASGSYEGEGFIIVRHRETGVVERSLEKIITLVQVDLA